MAIIGGIRTISFGHLPRERSSRPGGFKPRFRVGAWAARAFEKYPLKRLFTSLRWWQNQTWKGW
jgi:hypothetical protein